MLQHPPAETGRNIFSLHLWRNAPLVIGPTRILFTFAYAREFSGYRPPDDLLDRKLVEPIGIEPMTPCLQSRCSPS